MAEAVFHPPRRKRRVYESYDSPFPISSSKEGIHGKVYKICQAEIINNNVIVKNPEDIKELYSKGFFGKGILSRSHPEYSISDPVLFAKWQGARLNMPIISSKKYQCHVEWAKSLMQEQGLDDYTINKVILNYTKPLLLRGDTEQNNEPQGEDLPEVKNVEEDPKLAVSSSETNGGQVTCLDPLGSPSDPLSYCDSKKSDITDSKAAAKTLLTEQHPISVHHGFKEDCYVTQESHLLIDKEYDHEYVLIQEEESESDLCLEEAAASEKSHLIKMEKLVCRRNPFRIFEYLQLSLEEAFFLVYALGCLSIYCNEVPLSILKLWEVFSDTQPSFKATYMAYHYFRAKGWVPKVGLKYGTDLLLYRKGPPFYHASYSVIAEFVNDDFEGSLCRPFSWKSLSGLNRTTANVSKELMFCYLIKPSDMTEKEMSSPECLKRIKVQVLVLNRWVSSCERNEQEEL
ncbi:tRNA-splicing endonuclease subunit Sen2 [Varanus komodoensis]|uniref:tRNA-splicing endonuclease subunit Sen2 n=1 Tax=Varanus komodoensis TaxID=61221 RepID=UPI001CF7E243|nr:tRNA-splicing endonuclease subunit Sen2 [Varanus komodoensis]XP_044307309.1 tRNA-splicing endonuclease subunit Sen2 [Varanus komodoensis]XP_044307310.1 tRNA-splicing endonuclease subunit Sen2 [Varanus komodoensis]